MRQRTLYFLVFSALFLAIPSQAQTARTDFNRKRVYDVQHYKIQTNFDHRKRTVFGDTTVTLKPLAADLKVVELDAADLIFKSVTLDPSGKILKYRVVGDKVVVSLDKAYGPADTIAIRLVYSTTKPTKGVYFVEPEIDGSIEKRSAQIYSQGEADENRHWFPSFDFPSDKATSEQIITADKKYSVVANGELLDMKENPNGTTTWHYKMPVPHSSYLTSFVIGKYKKVEGKYKNVPLGFYVYPERESIVPKAYGNTPEMMRIYEELTGIPFPYNKYDQTTVAAFNFGGMENITATTMSDNDISMAAIPFMQGNIEDLVSHELAHSWFGDLVTCKNWAELWLNEGFATFMEAAYRERKYDRKDYMRKIEEDADEFMTEDAVLVKNHGLYNEDAGNVAALFDHSGVTYSKGGAVIHTLREQVGDANFWKAINIYLNRFKFGNVESTDLRQAMEETSGQDLGWFFDQWVYGIGSPKLTVAPIWDAAAKTLTLTVTQTQKIGGLNVAAYRLPMNIEFTTPLGAQSEKLDVDKRVQTFTYNLAAKPTKIEIDKEVRIPIKTVKISAIR